MQVQMMVKVAMEKITFGLRPVLNPIRVNNKKPVFSMGRKEKPLFHVLPFLSRKDSSFSSISIETHVISDFVEISSLLKRR